MSLNKTMTSLMDSARKYFEVDNKLSIANLINLFNPNENLITNTANWGDPNFVNMNNSGILLTNDYYRGLRVIHSTQAWNSPQLKFNTKEGKTYTFSTYAKGNQEQPYGIYIFLTGESSPAIPSQLGGDTCVLTKDWQRYSFTFKAIRDATIHIRLEQATANDLYLAGYKLEEGSLATPLTETGGEVINPNLIADWANNLIDSRVSLSDGIISFNNPNGECSSADFYSIRRIKLTPGHTYRLNYRVRGTGYVRTFVYAYNDKETGDYVDNGHTVQLENSWQTVIYTFKYNPAEDNPSLIFSFRPGNADQDTRASKGEAADFCLVDISQ